MDAPRVIIIAGPNGAGKTTFARDFLPNEAQLTRFINADLIAAGLSPFAPEAAAIQAGRLMLEAIASCVGRRESFAFETTLAGQSDLRHIALWRQLGYIVTLLFLALPSAEVAMERVARRVRQGGHHVQPDVVRRKSIAGRQNFDALYRLVVDDWALYDNSCDELELIEWGQQ